MAWKLLVLLEEAAEAALSADVWDMTGVGDDEGTSEVVRRMVDDIKMARHRRMATLPKALVGANNDR